jgi:4-aminobutyrate aminotransferase-like enzyme
MCQVPSPDVYRGKYTDVNSAGEDLGVKYAGEVQAAIEAAEADGRKIAAFLSESLQSCAGQILPPAGYLSAVYRLVSLAVYSCYLVYLAECSKQARSTCVQCCEEGWWCMHC